MEPCIDSERLLTVGFVLVASAGYADALNCSLTDYKAAPGLTAAVPDDTLALTWDGDKDQEVRLRLTTPAARRRFETFIAGRRPARHSIRAPAARCQSRPKASLFPHQVASDATIVINDCCFIRKDQDSRVVQPTR